MSMIMTSDNSTSDSNISFTNNNDTNIDGLKEILIKKLCMRCIALWMKP